MTINLIKSLIGKLFSKNKSQLPTTKLHELKTTTAKNTTCLFSKDSYRDSIVIEEANYDDGSSFKKSTTSMVRECQETEKEDIINNVYIDTEVSSLEVDGGEVLQLSAVKLDIINRKYILKIFNKYIKPSELIDVDIRSMKINGISLAKCQCPKATAFNEFLDFCNGRHICGYNLRFDLNMINDDMAKEGIDFYKNILIGRDILAEVRESSFQFPDNRLSTVSGYLGLECNGYHNALFDCIATMYVDVALNYDNQINLDFNSLVHEYCKNDDNRCPMNIWKCQELFNGKNICISGDFCNFSRKELEDKIVNCGGILKSGMSKRVDIFINGFNPKPTIKERKYNELINSGLANIICYDENSLLERVQ